MSMLDLANKLLLYITQNLELGRDMNAFARTNRPLHSLLNPYLYWHNIQLFGSSALLWAAEHGQGVTAQNLLQEGADIQKKTRYWESPLLLAAKTGTRR
ncbi:hypothetical protein BGZ61DRAFT_468199 [Ilyonectria robusta]|uniref:uncharacterized protein n=1 Tax=Ilyonectria robusta TaxID=1079257 RepID=UPI001E8D1F8C|nr:uncharacterized protein BGZ61DRAFT_468199 [Ilyonectria robusta]KAH8652993.1 hypothetical protein BGZ61DRAFT_468199 [Ilyonectria robusta]